MLRPGVASDGFARSGLDLQQPGRRGARRDRITPVGLARLVGRAISAVRGRNLMTATAILGAYSLMMALLWCQMNALDVAFTDQSTGNPTSWSWNFGDGSSSSAQNPSHTYTSVGSYTVTLTVSDGFETGVDTATATVNTPPVADAGGDQAGKAGFAMTFDGSGSSDADGTIASYDWDFGDGSTGTGVNPTHTYVVFGTYTVTLTVTDGDEFAHQFIKGFLRARIDQNLAIKLIWPLRQT